MSPVAIQNFWFSNKSKFLSKDAEAIVTRFKEIDDATFFILEATEFRDPVMFFTLSLVVGWLGIDRLLCGDIKLGLFKLFTFGGLFLYYIYDLFIITNDVKKKNFVEFSTLTN